MALKINQSVSKDAQARTLLKELLKVHQIHQAYNVRELTDADEQILEKAFNTTREMMSRISAKEIKFEDKKWDSLFNFLMAEQISFARVLTNGDDN
jgi:molybdopterin-guanine dinucleotide biosynthesis protein A